MHGVFPQFINICVLLSCVRVCTVTQLLLCASSHSIVLCSVSGIQTSWLSAKPCSFFFVNLTLNKSLPTTPLP